MCAQRSKDLAIIGAGVGGLALGLAMRRAGWRVRVFDRFDTPAPVGSGLVIQPVGQAVLHGLGVGERAEALGNKIYRMAGHEICHGIKVLDVTYDAPGEPRFGLAIHRAALFDCLFQAALDAGVDIQSGQEVIAADKHHVETAAARHGPFDLVVDASGAGSRLSPLSARQLPFGALWATVDWPDQAPTPLDELRQCYDKANHMVGVLPIGRMTERDSQRKTAIFWSLPTAHYRAWRAKGIDAWRDEAKALWPEFSPFADQVQSADQMTMACYSHGTLRRPYTRDLILIGDAAHRASPQLGQGANMALLDAAILARALQTHPDALARAAELYASQRRWHVRAYQVMSWAFTPMYQSDSRALPLIRDRVLAPLAMRPMMRRILTRLVCGDLLPPHI